MFKVVILVLMATTSCWTQDAAKAGIHHPHHMMGHQLCMAHCSYVCMASSGKIETCSNLHNPNNSTLADLPDMASCPTATTAVNDCFLKCGCQCIRCGVCLMKNMKPMAASEAWYQFRQHFFVDCFKKLDSFTKKVYLLLLIMLLANFLVQST